MKNAKILAVAGVAAFALWAMFGRVAGQAVKVSARQAQYDALERAGNYTVAYNRHPGFTEV